MEEGKASAGIAMTFVAGVAATSYSLEIFHIGRSGTDTASVLGFSAVTVLLMLLCTGTASGYFRRHAGRFICLAALVWFLAGSAIAMMSAVPAVTANAEEKGFAMRCAGSLKQLIDGIPYGDPSCNALVKAFLTGDQSDLTDDVRTAFRDSGASHLLALSGMHLSIIYLVISRMLSVFGNAPATRLCRSAVIIASSAFFTVMTGAVPSLVRAFLFILLRECASMTGRTAGNIHIFSTALLLQLALTPETVTSVGFQLSYLAMLGIFLLYKPIDNIWEKAVLAIEASRTADTGTGNTFPDGVAVHDGYGASTGNGIGELPDGQTGNGDDGLLFGQAGRGKDSGISRNGFVGTAMRRIWSMCALSISCQITTAPAVLLYFGTFPQYFLVTNLLCIPLSNAIMVISMIILPLQAAGICPDVLIAADAFLIGTMTWILDTIASL